MKKIHINEFLSDYYIKSKRGTGYTVGTVEERQKLDRNDRGFLMPIIQIEIILHL